MLNSSSQPRILQLLRRRTRNFVSGEELAAELGMSRTGVWKHIQKLKSMGYEILSHPKDGYMLLDTPDSLCAEEIMAELSTAWLGRSYYFLESVDSTNSHT